MRSFLDFRFQRRVLKDADKNINLAGFTFGSCITGSFIYTLPKMLSNPSWGFGPIVSFNMFIVGLCAGLLSGLVLGFLIWLLFRVSKSGIYKIHYVFVSLLGLFAGFELMRLFDKSGVFLR